MIEFVNFGKTPRFNRDVMITEKIDGTNAGVHVRRVGTMPDGTEYEASRHGPIVGEGSFGETPNFTVVTVEGVAYMVAAQSRKRMIAPNSDGVVRDNYGFAAWVWANAEALARVLGEGLHFGEWFGEGIQRNPHAIEGRRFALFDAYRWSRVPFAYLGLPDVQCVPVLHSRARWDWVVDQVADLRENGSTLGGKAEGVIVYHPASGAKFKVLCEGDEMSKTERDAA